MYVLINKLRFKYMSECMIGEYVEVFDEVNVAVNVGVNIGLKCRSKM